jgi:hypothetical protein
MRSIPKRVKKIAASLLMNGKNCKYQKLFKEVTSMTFDFSDLFYFLALMISSYNIA